MGHYGAEILATLKKWWGYEGLRNGQGEVIESVLNGRDTLVLMPTGGGKSLLYQVPTMMREGVCIVVTPLVSLMKDQVDQLRQRGMNAVAIHGGLSPRKIDIALDNCVYGDVKFLYVAPERLGSEVFRARVSKMKVSLLAVDEAHCISQWGYDFRPSYLRIAELRRLVPDTPVLALTATATVQVAEDIMRHLAFAEPNVIRHGLLRPNLSYVVRKVDDKVEQMCRILTNVEGSAIVYVRLREKSEKVAEELKKRGFAAEFYHAGLSHTERALRQDEWQKEKVRVMVATNAFGMGINKGNVRAVIHYDMCDSPEAYYQEAGRAGRDGVRSYAVLLMDSYEKANALKRLEGAFPGIPAVKEFYDNVCSSLMVAYGEGAGVSFVFNEYKFAEQHKMSVSAVRNCFKLLAQSGYLMLTDESDHSARMRFVVSREDLYNFRENNRDVEEVMLAILRQYEGVFTDFRPIDIENIAFHAHCEESRVVEVLRTLWRKHIVEYRPRATAPMVMFLCDRVPKGDVFIAPEVYRMRKESAKVRLEAMLNYAAQDDNGCRSRFLQQYFGEEGATECGVCDLCIERRREGRLSPARDEEIARTVREEIALNGSVEASVLARKINIAPADIARVVEKLTAEGEICSVGGGFVKKNR
ncbi:MAG: RecQ family ATP-dependent DNA helicase [Tidjanibacter sp.]|nr:RecQ family ATP-dependent DNA helicase [Tidjanibacter sp.]